MAVQIISNLYHNYPEQRTLLVTHSNQALNQLFEKIMAIDIDERHLLRLGHGTEELETEKDFSRCADACVEMLVLSVLSLHLDMEELILFLLYDLSCWVKSRGYRCVTACYMSPPEVVSVSYCVT